MRVNFNSEEQQVLRLNDDLLRFKAEHNMDERKEQIKYAGTMKKVKSLGARQGLSVRARSTGVEVRLQTEHSQTLSANKQYEFAHAYNRYFKNKLKNRLGQCIGQREKHNKAID